MLSQQQCNIGKVDFSRNLVTLNAYISKTVSLTKKHHYNETPLALQLLYATIKFALELPGEAERPVTGSVPKNPRKLRFFGVNDPVSVKFRNSEKDRMRTPIHVLCSYFREIGGQEVPQTARCCPDKKFLFTRPLDEGRRNFPGEHPT